MAKPNICVILTVYQRPHLLEEQLQAIEQQTIPPEKITLWINNPLVLPQIQSSLQKRNLHVIVSSQNMKFFPRFAIALCQQSEYTTIFDDDTIPGYKWFANCLSTLEQTGDAILGTAGVILHGQDYRDQIRIGCDGKLNTEIKEVDLACHTWFLKTENFKYLWYERPFNLNNGEDITLSYLAQKYGKLKTYIPPHPPDKKDLHGSVRPEYGHDKFAHSSRFYQEHFYLRNKIIEDYINKGWLLIKDNKL